MKYPEARLSSPGMYAAAEPEGQLARRTRCPVFGQEERYQVAGGSMDF